MQGTDTVRSGAMCGIALALPTTFIVLTIVLPLPVLPLIVAAFGGQGDAERLVPLAIVLPTFGIAVSSALLGLVGLGRDPGRLFRMSTAVFSVAAVLPLWLNDLHLFVMSRALAGLALGVMQTCAIALTAAYFSGRQRMFWLAAQSGGAAGAAILGAALAGALGEIGWRLPFAPLFTGSGLLALLLVRPLPVPTVASDPAPSGGAKPCRLPSRMMVAVAIWTILASLLIFPPAYEFGFLLAERHAASASLTGALTAALGIGALGGASLAARLPALPPQAFLAASFTLAAGGMSIFIQSLALAPALGGAFLIGAAQGLVVPALLAWLLATVQGAARDRAIGLFQTLLYLSQFGAPLIARTIAITWGSARAGMVVYAVACVPCVLLLWVTMLRRPSLRHQNDEKINRAAGSHADQHGRNR